MFQHAFNPISLGGVDIPNRIVRTAHATRIGGGRLSDELIAYHMARANGGVGLSILEICSVHKSSPGSLNVFDPTLPAQYEKLMTQTRSTGMRVFQQLWHAGHDGRPLDGGPTWAPSDIPCPLPGKSVPRAMTVGQIEEIIESFAKTAKFVKENGLDGCEVHGAHGFLVQQFLSPSLNRREDDYGGSEENRMRFPIEVMRAIRGAVGSGDNFAVGIRLSNDMTTGGVNEPENRALIKALCTEGLIDYVSVSQGNNHTFPDMIGGMHEPVGYELERSVPVGEAADVPVLLSGRFRTVEEADQAIRLGQADMVALTRATLADPDLVAKTKRGEIERIRPCIACNQGCIGQLLGPEARLGCAVNAAGGFETSKGDDKLPPVEAPKKVLVIGGGPSGMEAARIAAKRGHKVTLMEAMPKLGGTLALAGDAPRRQSFHDILHWLETEIYTEGVDVQQYTFVAGEDITAFEPDHVILATGAEPRVDGVQVAFPGELIEGFDGARVISSNEVLETPELAVESAVVIDDVGHYEALAVSEHLVERGIKTTLVTRHKTVAPDMWGALMVEPALSRLSEGAFEYYTMAQVLRMGDNKTTIKTLGRAQPIEIESELVVFVSLNAPRIDLVGDLEDAKIPYTIVGDAKIPRFLVKAIADGNEAGRSV